MKALLDGDRGSRKGRNKYTASTYITDTHKQCSLCNQIKIHNEFHKDKANKHGQGLAYYCKECANAKSRKWTQDHGSLDKYRKAKWNSYYIFKYGISLEERNKLLEQQDNKCCICKVILKTKGTHTHTDHDHSTGKVRGILCTNCNRGLGHFKDNMEILMEAITYLQSHTDNGNQKEGRCL